MLRIPDLPTRQQVEEPLFLRPDRGQHWRAHLQVSLEALGFRDSVASQGTVGYGRLNSRNREFFSIIVLAPLARKDNCSFILIVFHEFDQMMPIHPGITRLPATCGTGNPEAIRTASANSSGVFPTISARCIPNCSQRNLRSPTRKGWNTH